MHSLETEIRSRAIRRELSPEAAAILSRAYDIRTALFRAYRDVSHAAHQERSDTAHGMKRWADAFRTYVLDLRDIRRGDRDARCGILGLGDSEFEISVESLCQIGDSIKTMADSLRNSAAAIFYEDGSHRDKQEVGAH